MKKYPEINESFICKIWEGREKYYTNLRTSNGHEVIIFDIGKRNFDAGPDYLGAKIQIGGKIYKGDVEIHRDYQSWSLHNHEGDRNYNAVILQVVLWAKGDKTDPMVKRKRLIPTIVLSKYLTRSIYEIWQEIIMNPSLKFILPCHDYNESISDETVKVFLSKLAIERLNLRSNRLRERLQELIKEETGESNYNLFLNKSTYWKQVFYEFFLEALGFSKNKEPMIKLARCLTINKIIKFIRNTSYEKIFIIQALLFGYSGFLNEIRSKSGYPFEIKQLWNSFDKFKADSKPVDISEWKFFRLRPSNFPTVRLAYASQIIYKIIYSDLFKQVIQAFSDKSFELKTVENKLRTMFKPEDDIFWNYHYKLTGIPDGGQHKRRQKINLAGKERINDIITNVTLPFIFLYSQVFKADSVKLNVLKFYSSHNIKTSNSIVKMMAQQLLQNKGIKVNTPAIEQAVIQLYNFYCSRERCDECKIGLSFVKEKGYGYKIIFY